MNVWIVALCLVLASSILVKGECENTIIEGVITAIDGSEITLDDGTTVEAAGADITITTKGVKAPAVFDDLKVDMAVKVSGTDVLDVFVADKINVRYGGK